MQMRLVRATTLGLFEGMLSLLEMHLVQVLATPLGIPYDECAETREEQAKDGQHERTEVDKTRHGMLATEEQVIASVEHVVATNGDQAGETLTELANKPLGKTRQAEK